MEKLLVCNTGSDKISIINLSKNKIDECPLYLEKEKSGPYNMDFANNTLYIANNYSNSISIFDLNSKKEVKSIYVGAHPNDCKVYKDKIYIICGDSNSLNIMDLFSMERLVNIALDGYPHSIAINKINAMAYVCNTEGNSLSIINCETDTMVKRIEIGNNPTKVLLSSDKSMLFICESNFEDSIIKGNIIFMSIETNEIIKRVKVGLNPVDIYEDNNRLFVANLGDSTISIIDIKRDYNVENIRVKGCPISLVKYKEKIYYSDYFNGIIYSINLINLEIEKIALGREPNAMIILPYH